MDGTTIGFPLNPLLLLHVGVGLLRLLVCRVLGGVGVAGEAGVALHLRFLRERVTGYAGVDAGGDCCLGLLRTDCLILGAGVT